MERGRFSFCSTPGQPGWCVGVVSSVGVVPGAVLVTGEAGDELTGQPTSKRAGGASCPSGRRLLE